MRMLFSIVGFALFIVGCQSLVPLTERTIELPTLKYQRDMEKDQTHTQPSTFADERAVVNALRDACRKDGRFSIVHRGQREGYTCYPEEE